MNNKNLWWEGPIFLKEQDIFENKDVIEIDIIEEKSENTFVCLSDIKDQVDLNEVLNFNKYSNFGGGHKGSSFCVTSGKKQNLWPAAPKVIILLLWPYQDSQVVISIDCKL